MLIGATPEGKKELVGLQTGVREGPQSWRELLIDIKRRGLEIAPDLAVGDGGLGFWKAIEEVWRLILRLESGAGHPINAYARCRARGCRSPAFCVRDEREAGVQDHRLCADDGALPLPSRGRHDPAGEAAGVRPERRHSATDACTCCCNERASR